MRRTLSKVYEPSKVEARWSRLWIERGYFTADPHSKKPPFSMVIPPPNITGSLHLGHALNNTLQDIMARFKRMQGYNVLWLPGIDHAGIATQNVVERELMKEGLSREELGRDEFVKRVWQWKEKSGDTIINQLKRLGASCDWTRLRFTMDEGLSRAVREVFVRLYREGLIYRGDYIINWCPRCMTALSDLEVEHEQTQGKLYYLNYPLKDGTGFVTVATTRPETMLGDVAVAVNPQDERYRPLKGRTLVLPIVERQIPIIEDPVVDMEFGTGAVKITPAHDFNDFEVARRHGLGSVVVMDKRARMNENAGPYRGLDRFEAREKIVEELKGRGLLKRVEDYALSVGTCYRCKTVVEPMVSKQWFVKTAPLSGPAIRVVEEGTLKFVPKSWEKTYFEWMHNIRDWCISRQIWWGHRIPAWYCKRCPHITVSVVTPERCEGCSSDEIEQDPDVLDTWFSSALWPFSTLGWPDDTEELRVFYPTSALFTSFDIIFFWVARMIMMGLKFMGDVPFRDVYIHALIRDARGQKMSKSKGNVIDPLVMMERYGTDALRFTLAVLAAQGRDIKLAEERIEGYRNFANKLWNLARFTMMHLDDEEVNVSPGPENYSMADRWILTRLKASRDRVVSALEGYQFDVAAKTLYGFIWHELCDWYVEAIKPDLKGEKGELRRKTSQAVLLKVLADTLKLLHPFMPFITDEIHFCLTDREESLVTETYPEPRENYPESARKMETVMDVIRCVRNIRVEFNIPHGIELECVVLARKTTTKTAIEEGTEYIKALSRVKEVRFITEKERPEKGVFNVARGVEGDAVEVFVPLKGYVDVRAEVERLERELEKVEDELSEVRKRLENENFLKKAPPHVVEKERTRSAELEERRAKLLKGLERVRAL